MWTITYQPGRYGKGKNMDDLREFYSESYADNFILDFARYEEVRKENEMQAQDDMNPITPEEELEMSEDERPNDQKRLLTLEQTCVKCCEKKQVVIYMKSPVDVVVAVKTKYNKMKFIVI